MGTEVRRRGCRRAGCSEGRRRRRRKKTNGSECCWQTKRRLGRVGLGHVRSVVLSKEAVQGSRPHALGAREKVETAHVDSPVEEFYYKREQRRGAWAVWDHLRAKGRLFGWLCFLYDVELF